MPRQPTHAELQYIELADFTQGIHSDYFSKTGEEQADTGTAIPVLKDGALQEAGTYGCVGAPTGGLIPLPRVRAYLQDEKFYNDLITAGATLDTPGDYILPWGAIDWKTSVDGRTPIRVPIVAARVMPAFVGPARVPGDDIPATEPLSHNPVVYWRSGTTTIVDLGTDGLNIASPQSDIFSPCSASDLPVYYVPTATSGEGTFEPATPQQTFMFWAKKCRVSAGNFTIALRYRANTLIFNGSTNIPFTPVGASWYVQLGNTTGAAACQRFNNVGGDIGATASIPVTYNEWELWVLQISAGVAPAINVKLSKVGSGGITSHTATFGAAHDASPSYSTANSNQGTWTWRWQTDYRGIRVSGPSGPCLAITRDHGWDLFGMGFFPGVSLTDPDMQSIYDAQAAPLATFVPGFVTPGTRPDLTSGDISFPGLVAVTYDFYVDDTNAADYDERMIARLYKPWLLAPVEGPNVIGTDFYDAFTASIEPLSTDRFYGYAQYEFTRSRHADPTVIGPPFLIILASPYHGDNTTKKLLSYPAPSTLTADSVLSLTTNYLFGVLAHQARVTYLGHSSEEGANLSFGTQGTIAAFERWGWFAPNDFQNKTNDLTTVFVEENPFGYGAWGSVNASEAILVKQMGGGVVVRDDFDNPTVVRLPGIASTGAFFNIGCFTPFGSIWGSGFIYGSIRGLYLWNGGDHSEHLSPQLSPRALVADDGSVDDYVGMKGSIVDVGKFVFAPNSWVYYAGNAQGTTGSWWKLRNHPDVEANFPFGYPAIWYQVDTLQRLYSFPSYLEVGLPDDPLLPPRGHNVFCQVYDLEALETKFQARTQPLVRTRARELRFREIILRARGHGRVTITLDGFNASKSETFDIDTDTVAVFRRSFGLAASDVVCTILSEGSDPDTTAPYVRNLSLGYAERQKVGA